MDYTKEAKYLIGRGISVVPLTPNGSKKPMIKWKEFQSRIMSEREADKYFKRCGGIAAITGKTSNLVCFDFDTDKELYNQDFWKDFINLIPDELKRKFNINRTRSGGSHIWLRARGFSFPSRKIAHRYLTIPELHEKLKEYNESECNTEGYNPDAFQRALLNKPLECIIETRFEGMYGVLVHKDYEHLYGDSIKDITLDEYLFLERMVYSLDCGFIKKQPFVGDEDEYALITKFCDDCTPEDVSDMMCSTGLYKRADVELDYNGNILLERVGSSNPYSSKVFRDTSIVVDHGMSNLFSDGLKSHNPYQVLKEVNGWTSHDVIKYLSEKYG